VSAVGVPLTRMLPSPDRASTRPPTRSSVIDPSRVTTSTSPGASDTRTLPSSVLSSSCPSMRSTVIEPSRVTTTSFAPRGTDAISRALVE
jgi:hypothetical protein